MKSRREKEMGFTWISLLITFALLPLHLTVALGASSSQSNSADDDDDLGSG